MDRPIVWAGSLPRSTDFLTTNQQTMISLGWLMQTVLGTGIVAAGLTVTPTGTPSMSVSVAAGALATWTPLEVSNYGAIPSDAGDSLVKMGINIGPTVMGPFTAPTTAGQSVDVLIQAAFLEADGTPVVVPYYNASNPATPFNGPFNSGAPQNTLRTQRVYLQAVVGTPATTGTQTVPTGTGAPIAVLTIPYGATSITSGMISVPSTAPFITTLPNVRQGRLLNEQVFTSSATYTKTPGTNTVRVRMVGGGAGAGGADATGASQGSVTAGGGAGTYAEAFVSLVGVNTVAVTIGGGGAGGIANNTGTAGGASSFGSFLSCPGGLGSPGCAAVTTTVPYIRGAAGQASAATFGSGTVLIVDKQGEPGVFGLLASASGVIGGNGGDCPFGTGGANSAAAGQAGTGYGAGGGGCGNIPSGSAQTGGAGAGGYCIVEEYS